MNTLRYTEVNFAKRLSALAAASSLFDPVIEQRTRAILDEVRSRGDAALVELTERFDGARLAADQLAVTQAELVAASLKADDSLRAAVADAAGNIAGFARKSRRRDWQTRNSHGATVGEKFDPVPTRRRLHPRRHRAAGFHRLDDGNARQGSRLPRNRRLHPLRQGWRHQPRHPVCGPGSRRDRNLPGRRRAGDRRHGLWHRHDPPGAEDLRPRQCLRRRGQATGVRPRRHRLAPRPQRIAGGGG